MRHMINAINEGADDMTCLPHQWHVCDDYRTSLDANHRLVCVCLRCGKQKIVEVLSHGKLEDELSKLLK